MRLICPNCGAQYEVPDEVIPAAGRDVQCSSCGHTWFQAHADQDVDAASDMGRPVPDEDWLPEAMSEEDELPDPAPVEDDADAPEAEPRPAPSRVAMSASPPETAAAPSAQRRKLDPAVADILRDEAQREVAARKTSTLETQPELGLNEPMDEEARRAEQARIRMARMRGLPDEEPATPRPEGGTGSVALISASRRDLLPDIDEINSTLRSTSERRAREAGDGDAEADMPTVQEEAAARSGFRRGFFLSILVFLLLTALYVFAPQIVARVPALEPALVSYVEMVNDLRVWLSDMVANLGARFSGNVDA